MKLNALGSGLVGMLILAACSSAGVDGDESLGSASESIIGPSTLGGRNEVVMMWAHFVAPNGSIGTRTCSGTYFAPRVVVTAAHCLQNLTNEVFVYFGDNFEADFPQLTFGPRGLEAPPPGQPSFFARADSFESHPSYDPAQHHPDIGVIYLDRKLPFDPLPLSRTVLAANRQVTISGWGANSAPTPTSGAGGRVQRTGTTVTLGSPTAADFHPEDPNPSVQNATSAAAQIKTDGRPPNANGCFGDSGGPILITESGQTRVAGVNYFTGLSCLDYNLSVRVSSFLPFLDQAYKKGGQEVLKPVFDCVAPNPNGTLTAFFGYDNKNGVSVTVPYGTKNALARDTAGQRPTRFLPGQHHFTFGVDFASTQTVSWTLAPDNSPATTLNVNQNSKRCGAAEFDQSECGLSCRASTRSGCVGTLNFEDCVNFCVANNVDFRNVFPNCTAQNTAINTCTARTSPDPANWECFEGFPAFALTPCAAEFEAFDICASSP